MALLAGLDVGTSSVKGLLISSEDGAVVARAEVAHPLSTPRPGWAEQDPEDWWAGAQAVLFELGRAGEIAGIGLTGQMHGLVALDASDCVLRPAILWNDGRTAAQCAEIERRVGLQALIAQTGNRALPGFTAPKLLWLAEHEPDVYARIDRVLLPKDFVRLRLCGEHATDVADASGTLLFDVARRCWSDAVVQALEIDPGWLPRALESPEVSGQTAGGVPVAAGAGDQAAGALGVGVDRPGPASVVLGTSGVVFAASAAFAPDRMGRVHAFCHAVPGAWHSMGVMLSAAGSLRWLRDVAAQEVEFAALVTEAAVWEPGVEGLTFLPYLAGERTPHADPAARSCARCSRASRSACATAWTSLRICPAGRRSGASRAAARAASCGCASSRRCSSCRCSARPSTRARRSARRCWAASRQARSRMSTRRSPRACGRARSSSPSRSGSRPTVRRASASSRCTRRLHRAREAVAVPAL